MSVPRVRIRGLIDASPVSNGDYVLYWMSSARRGSYNFSLQRALELCRQLNKPLLVLEALRVDYPWASQRLHQFILEGMRDNRQAFAKAGVSYLAYVEPERHHGRGLVRELGKHAAYVVTDDFPCFFLPDALAAATHQLKGLPTPPPFETVDGNGLLPLRATERIFTTAQSFRIYLRKVLDAHQAPAADPLAGYDLGPVKLRASLRRWFPHGVPSEVRLPLELKLTYDIAPSTQLGGSVAAGRQLMRFIHQALPKYGQERNHPDDDGGSGLSPYLHFGHISAHEVVQALRTADAGTALSEHKSPLIEHQSEAAAAFSDELITWRELGLNMCAHHPNYDQLSSLPGWAKQTIDAHRDDPREYVYSLEQFERAQTHDEVWNAAQRQLLSQGRMHNYLRMLWGKKIYEWSARPEDALATMLELNNKYALDGRDPNSYSGIFWVLGRYDRAWGPERPVFGKLRYMSTDSARRKLRLKRYLKRHGESQLALLS